MWEPTVEINNGRGRQAESALYHSELQFRRLLDKLPAGAYTCDPQGLITYFNQQAVQLWGRAPKLNDPVDRFCGSFKLFSADGSPLTHDQCWMALALRIDQEYNGHEIIIERPDGQRLTALAYANPIHDEAGKLLGAVNVLVDITERKRVELAQRLVAEASHLLATSLDYTLALTNLAQLVVPDLADWCAVDVMGEDGLIHRLAVIHQDPTKAELAAQLQHYYSMLDPQGEHTVARVLRQDQSWFDTKVTKTRLAAEARDAEHLRLLQGLGFASEIVVPLTARGHNLGALTLVRTSLERRYDATDLALAEEIARLSAIVIDNARLYEAEQLAKHVAEQTAERIAGLQAVTAALSKALTPIQVAKAIINEGLVPLGVAGGIVMMLDEPDSYLHIVDYFGYSTELINTWRHFPVSLRQGPLSDALLTGQPVFIESLGDWQARYPNLNQQQAANHVAWAALPLEIEERIVGVIGLTFAQGRPYSVDERAFLLAVAQQCAQALERARLYEVEQKARIEAEAAQQRLALLAEMRERNRMAQELHDTVAQALGYLNLKIGMTHTLLADNQVEAAKANLQELKNVVGETYTDVREEIFNLRAKVQSGMGFMEVLDRYIEKYRRFYNLDIQRIQEADPTLFQFPAEVTPQLIRTIQEALINIRKHARVTTAIIRLGQEAEHLRLTIEDQGWGFDPNKIKEKTASFGLQIMRERVESVGGSLEVDTAPGRGTRIILRYRQ
jgi:signal transduction histidine kinase